MNEHKLKHIVKTVQHNTKQYDTTQYKQSYA